jgi:hypothetical protein
VVIVSETITAERLPDWDARLSRSLARNQRGSSGSVLRGPACRAGSSPSSGQIACAGILCDVGRWRQWHPVEPHAGPRELPAVLVRDAPVLQERAVDHLQIRTPRVAGLPARDEELPARRPDSMGVWSSNWPSVPTKSSAGVVVMASHAPVSGGLALMRSARRFRCRSVMASGNIDHVALR